MQPFDREGFKFQLYPRLKGESRMLTHNYDPDSDDDDYDDEFGRKWRRSDYSEIKRCKDESCGDIIDDNGQAHIVADYTGWNKAGLRYTRALLDDETHEDAKNSLCQLKGCSRCDMALNRCVSNTHDTKVSRSDIWIPFLHSHLLQFTPQHLQQLRTLLSRMSIQLEETLVGGTFAKRSHRTR